MKLRLINPTNDQINAAVAEYIAGWTDIRFEEGEDVDIESRTIYPWEGMRGKPPGGEARRMVPAYSILPNFVLPFLEKEFISFKWNPGDRLLEWLQPHVGAPATWEFCFASVPLDHAFSLAACIALLHVHGVEVEFSGTSPQ